MNTRFLSLLFPLILGCSSAIAQVCDKIVITGPPAGPPSSWTADGKLVGASVEFVKSVLVASGVKNVEARAYENWPKALEATQRGEVDLIFSAAWSEERARFLNFVLPAYAGQYLYVIVRKGERFPLRKYADLKGRIGVAGRGEAYGNSKFGVFVANELALERSASITQSFELLLEGKVDYVMAYENAANSEIFKYNLGEKVDVISTYPFYAETYIALSKRSKCAESVRALLTPQLELARQKNLYFLLTNKYRNIFYETLQSQKP
jgi:polar amino acid transport system substrate-binding protein